MSVRNYILHNRKKLLQQYKNRWGKDVCLDILPKNISHQFADRILRKMVETGNGFTIQYYICKNNGAVDLIPINRIKFKHPMAEPRDEKVKAIMADMIKGNVSPVVLNSNNELEYGYTSYLLLKQLGERYVPYIKAEESSVRLKRMSNIREYLYKEQKGICYICERKTVLSNDYESDNTYATIDHFIPLIKGGNNSLSNMRICCKECNILKGSFSYSDALVEVITNELKERGSL